MLYDNARCVKVHVDAMLRTTEFVPFAQTAPSEGKAAD